MATDFDIADTLERLKDLYGDRFNTKAGTIEAWLQGLKFAQPENLKKSVQYWVENSPKTPTLFDIILTVRKFQPLRRDSNQDERNQEYRDLEQANLRNGLRKIKTGDNAITWKRKEQLCIYKGQHTEKIEAILDYFGEKDWLTVLRTELNLKPENGLNDIHLILRSPETRKRYAHLVDMHLQMIPEVQAA